MDPELACPGARRGDRRPTDRLGALAKGLRIAQDIPFLRQHDEVGAVGRGLADEPLRDLEIAGHLAPGVHLYGRSSHLN